MTSKLERLCAALVIGWVGQCAEAALTHSPLTSMTATASGSPLLGQPPIPNDPAAQILTLNSISVSELQLGTTTFSGTPALANQLPQYADEFGLSANASADGQTYVQTMFSQPTAMVFLIEKGGNDNGTMIGLDASGQPIGLPATPFTASSAFNRSLGYNVYEQQVAGGMVITSDILIHGIRFNAPGIDPVSISSLPYQTLDSGELFTWGARIADGSWSNTSGWQKNAVNTTEIPQVIQVPPAQGSADPVQIVSGTVRVNTGDQSALSLQVDGGATVNVAAGNKLRLLNGGTISLGGALQLSGTFEAQTLTAPGLVSFSGGQLSVQSANLANVSVAGTSTISGSNDVVIGKLTAIAGGNLIKQSNGTLVLDQSAGANVLPPGSAISIEQGVVGAVNGTGSNALGSASINLNGGALHLASASGSPTAFNAPVVVNTEGVIRAAQVGGSLASGSVTLGGSNGISISAGGRAILQTSDGYTLNVAGTVSGAGRVILDDGANVNFTAGVSAATVEFRGDTSGVTGTANVTPGVARIFAPTDATPIMNVGFAVGGPSEVIVDGLVDGSVVFSGTTDYTGVTTVRRGALFQNAGLFATSRLQFDGGRSSNVPLVGDYNGDMTVDDLDHGVWKAAFGNSVAPGTGADGNANGIVDAADYVVWRNDFGNSVGGPANTRLAVLESSATSLSRNIGTGAGEIYWLGSGGFASRGNTTTGQLLVNLEGGATLQWDSPTQGFNGQVLQLSSRYADGGVVLQNNIDVGSAEERVIQVAGNPDTNADWAEISGVISSSGASTDLLTINASGEGSFRGGLLKLTGQNTFANKLRIEDATVQAQVGVGLPLGSNLEFSANNDNRPAIFATSGTFARDIGTGSGQVFWADQGTPNPNAGGFAAIGGPLTVTLEGGAELIWNSADAGFNGQDLQLGSTYGTDVVTLSNNINIDAVTTERAIETFDNPFSTADKVRLTGNIRSSGRGHLGVDGQARVEFEGTINLAGDPGQVTGDLIVRDNTTIILNGGNHVIDDLDIENSSNVFINSTIIVEDDIFFGDSANQPQSTAGFGGIGTVTTKNADNSRIAMEAHTRLRPGADRDQIGTLTLNLDGDGSVEFETDGIFEMDFRQSGGQLEHDSLVVNEVGGSVAEIALEPGGGNTWTLELNALNSLAGLVSPSDEFDFVEWNSLIDLVIAGTNISLDVGAGTALVPNVTVVSNTFNVSSADVYYQVNGDLSGRLFVTGLSVLPGAATVAAVPEPASRGLVVPVVAGFIVARRRRFP